MEILSVSRPFDHGPYCYADPLSSQHVLSLPTFQSVRVYHAHTASVTSLSISPFPPPTSQAPRPLAVNRIASQSQKLPQRSVSVTSTSSSSPRARKPQVVPNTPSNAIYIATSSTDGNVCVASLVDIKDVQLRNFARPVQAVALSPDYKNDRAYLSGGLAGNLVLTVGGRAGTNTKSTTTGTASATAAGWLGTIGLGSNTGIDKVLHSGEGTISTIKWSLSGKYVVWINEYGIKIMRSHLHLDSEDSEFAWKRFAHVDPPHDGDWEEMASVWKSRVEWIDEKSLETDDDDSAREKMSPATAKLKQYSSNSRVEKLLVGWGDGIWIINIHPGGTGVGRNVGEKTVGRAEKVKLYAIVSISDLLELMPIVCAWIASFLDYHYIPLLYSWFLHMSGLKTTSMAKRAMELKGIKQSLLRRRREVSPAGAFAIGRIPFHRNYVS